MSVPNFSSLAGLEVAEKFVVVGWAGGWWGGEHVTTTLLFFYKKPTTWRVDSTFVRKPIFQAQKIIKFIQE